jgi:hypothetical protein
MWFFPGRWLVRKNNCIIKECSSRPFQWIIMSVCFDDHRLFGQLLWPSVLNPFSTEPILQIPLFFTCSNMDACTHMQLHVPPGRSKLCTRIFNYESTRRPPSNWPQAE